MKAPKLALTPFERTDYEERLARARTLMEQHGIDALWITTEANFRYFSGLHSQGWISPTRPMFLVLPRRRPPVAIIPSGSQVIMRRGSWIEDVRVWPAPRPEDDGVSLLREALAEAVGEGGRVGAEFGPETHLRMPMEDYTRLRRDLPTVEFVDGSFITRRLRMIKAPKEIERARAAAELLSQSFEALPDKIQEGLSERDIALSMQIDLLQRGVEKIPYIVAASGPGGYDTINSNPSDRLCCTGDILILDVGAMVNGYYCDFDRNFAFGKVDDPTRRAYERLYVATEAGIAAARAGALASDVWRAMAEALGAEAVSGTNVGRMGHGVGLSLTEPPSIHPDDRTVLEPGMVLAIEPGLAYADGQGHTRIMVHEENIVVTDDVAVQLSRRAPAVIPSVD